MVPDSMNIQTRLSHLNIQQLLFTSQNTNGYVQYSNPNVSQSQCKQAQFVFHMHYSRMGQISPKRIFGNKHNVLLQADTQQ